MRKTLHHMKFVNKHMGLLQSFAASVFLFFCHEIDINNAPINFRPAGGGGGGGARGRDLMRKYIP